MAINAYTGTCDKIPPLPLSTLTSSKGSIIPNRLTKPNFGTDSSITSSTKSKRRKNANSKSPYLNSEKVHLLSRVTEKRVVQKKAADFISSFPLAVNIYKANSDEFKSVKRNKRVKKSVLTLPNEQAPVPQTCTVSDMNDSEDFNHNDDSRKKRPKKRPTAQNRRSRNDFEFYDRDARYCSQFNIHLDCSSTDVIKNVNGDGKKALNRKKQYLPPKTKTEGKFNGHDVWKVLRNINRFQFRPSPPMSEEEIPLPRKKGTSLRFNSLKDTRFIETCRTEEFAYISSIEVDSKSPTSFSHSSSFDRVTVIDKKDEFSRLCEEFEKKIVKSQNGAKNSKNQKSKNKSFIRKSFRTCNKGPGAKESNQSTIHYNKGIEFKNYYDNSTIGTKSNYSTSNANEDSLTFNARIDVVKKNNGNIKKQTKNSTDFSESDNFISSVKSVSSNTGLQETLKGNKSSKACEEICNRPINGITKVVLSKGHDVVLSKRSETPKRKSRLATTLASASIVPKLTQTDIRRRLLNMKFPVVILGKDQVSSAIQIMDYDPPQFEGLDKQIWPFMIEWSDDCKIKMELRSILNSKETLSFDSNFEETSIEQNPKCHHFHGDYKINKAPNMKSDTSAYKKPNNRERKWSNDYKSISNKRDRNPIIPPMDITNELQQPKKQRPMRQLKDKMLKFLYKKPPAIDASKIDLKVAEKCNVNNETNGYVTNKADVTNNVKANTINDVAAKRHLSPLNPRLIDSRSVPIKRPWAKAKWASDFIENVIKKIKNGVYYNQDLKYDSQKISIVPKEASVQTRSISEKKNKRHIYESDAEQSPEQLLVKRNDLLKIIPGFDHSLPELEIHTLDTNKIEIKNCLTNIIVQFDITVPKESDKIGVHMKKSCSLIPLDKGDSNTKLFKCKATILNAMLPAELCSILPNMMREIVHSDIKSSQPVPINKTDSQLSTISELSHFEAFDCFKTISRLSILSPEVRHILSGRFSFPITKRQTDHRVKSIAYHIWEIETNLLTKMPEKLSMPCIVTCKKYNLKHINYTDVPRHSNIHVGEMDTCKPMQPYSSDAQSLVPVGQTYNLMNILKNMWVSYIKIGRINFCPSMQICTLSVDIKSENIGTKNIVMNIGNLRIDSIFENYANIKTQYNNSNMRLNEINFLPVKCYDRAICDSETKSDKKINQIHGSNHKVKRKSFVKLYKKCKSTSNIPTEKNTLSLTKIINLDDFFQLLGSKSLSCVLDGNSGKKILSSIITLKNWITEINSRQAILVLLLANKKDTPNLIRFRPVLLQGIAVNRITRASELDMEIEVIERENLNIISQFEGISYLPASAENKDNLLEELYWIAKTTASDYQRSFDESSEKLLKSLLEKRKKLNPSYLRVMARYVGLGLLKSPSKK